MDYRKHFSAVQTPQNDPIPNSGQVQNSASGYSWEIDDWKKLQRFLILGTSEGTYYISEHKLTKENAEAVLNCIKLDGKRVVKAIVEISTAGRAPKNDSALFALALCASFGDAETKKEAFSALPSVARIGTHLFHFINYVEGFRGWGRGLRTAIQDWYLEKETKSLVYDVTKYQSRDNWSHRDLLRLSHPKANNEDKNYIFHWIVKGTLPENYPIQEGSALGYLTGFVELQKTTNPKDTIKLIGKYNFPRELVPTELLKEKSIWEALLPHMPITALIRNLGNLSKMKILAQGQWENNKFVAEKLANEDILKRGKVHPITVLSALLTYSKGCGVRGHGEWEVESSIIEALNQAFYKSFINVQPTGKRIVLALDVSGSMANGEIAEIPGLTPRVGAATMAMVIHRTEQNSTIVSFQDEIVPLTLSKTDSLNSIVEKTDNLPFGRTDCAQPMLWAIKNNVKADLILILTDSETWYGKIHPSQVLNQYRKQFNIPAKLIVVGMVSNGFSIADPNDAGMLDIVGFDSSAPEIINSFVRDEI